MWFEIEVNNHRYICKINRIIEYKVAYPALTTNKNTTTGTSFNKSYARNSPTALKNLANTRRPIYTAALKFKTN